MLVVKEITVPAFDTQIGGSLRAAAGFPLSSAAERCDGDAREGCRASSCSDKDRSLGLTWNGGTQGLEGSLDR